MPNVDIFLIMIKNAILLAGGSGTRLRPFTNLYSKQLLYLSGKAVIDYPIQTLVDLGIKNLTITLGSSFAGQIIEYCGDGTKYGININYVYQGNPEGISQAINICKKYVADENNFLVILGDNWFEKPIQLIDNSAKIFLSKHEKLESFGVASIFNNKIINIEEKPKLINTNYLNYAITGLYSFDQKYFDYFQKTKKSNRQEYEIVDIINQYLNDDKLNYQLIDGEWNDAGTIENLNYLNYKLYKGN
tara:strand:- start:3003 stop:3740 length:738 start_codon:yes stop_codon:yes gene_type:complete